MRYNCFAPNSTLDTVVYAFSHIPSPNSTLSTASRKFGFREYLFVYENNENINHRIIDSIRNECLDYCLNCL